MLTDYTIVNLIGDIFKYIGIAFKFVGSAIGAGYNLFINTTSSICGFLGILGIASQPLKIALMGLVGFSLLAVVSLVPDVISYFACRLSRTYRNLSSKEEKREYRIKHTHFLLRAILATRNLASKRKAAKNAKKMEKRKEKRNKKVAKQQERVRQAYDIVDQILGEVPPVIHSEFGEAEDTFHEVPVEFDEAEDTFHEVPPEFLYEFGEAKDNSIAITDENFPNIKILSASNILVKMLRKDLVIQRRISSRPRPILVDFSNKPMELFTKQVMDEASGIRFHKDIDGVSVDFYLDDPNFLDNNHLYYLPSSKEELIALRDKLARDPYYQSNLKGFFTAHNNAMRK